MASFSEVYRVVLRVAVVVAREAGFERIRVWGRQTGLASIMEFFEALEFGCLRRVDV